MIYKGEAPTKWVLYKIQELERNEVLNMEMELNEYIKHFDSIFHTNIIDTIKTNKFPMIELAFQTLGEYIYARNKHSNTASEQLKIISKEFQELNNEKAIELLNKYDELACEIDFNTKKQLLTFGFCICLEQLKEMGAIKFEKKN